MLLSLAEVNYFDYGDMDVAINYFPCLTLLLYFSNQIWPVHTYQLQKTMGFYLGAAVFGFLLTSFFPNIHLLGLGMLSFLISKFFLIRTLRRLIGFITVERMKSLAVVSLVSLICLLVFTHYLVDFTDPLLIVPVFIYFVANIILLYAAWFVFKNKVARILGVAGIIFHLAFDIISIFSVLLENFDSKQIITLTVGFLSCLFLSFYFWNAALSLNTTKAPSPS